MLDVFQQTVSTHQRKGGRDLLKHVKHTKPHDSTMTAGEGEQREKEG